MRSGFEHGSALDRVTTAVTIADPALPDVPVIYANQAFLDLTGYGLEHVLGRNCRFLQGTDTDRTTTGKMRQAIIERRDFETCLVNYTRTGVRFDNLIMLSHFEAAGQKRLILGCQFKVQPDFFGLDFQVRRFEETLGGIGSARTGARTMALAALRMRSQAIRTLIDHYVDAGDMPRYSEPAT